MLKDYFGEFSSGRVVTNQFIALWLILFVAFILFLILIGFGIGIAGQMMGSSIQEAQVTLRTNLGPVAIFVIFATCLALFIAKLNIIAKRARDAGLPGWLTAIIFAIIIGSAAQVVDEATMGGLSLLMLVILAFIPTDYFRRST
ncbi:DUF805 domain-containing protein [Rhodobacteraceae bacterium NNCM2]|nr:DUF805 domain-containing protein [Coraliihabitans acroporae]